MSSHWKRIELPLNLRDDFFLHHLNLKPKIVSKVSSLGLGMPSIGLDHWAGGQQCLNVHCRVKVRFLDPKTGPLTAAYPRQCWPAYGPTTLVTAPRPQIVVVWSTLFEQHAALWRLPYYRCTPHDYYPHYGKLGVPWVHRCSSHGG